MMVREPGTHIATPAAMLAHAGHQASPADSSLPQAATPQFSVAPGSYSNSQTVTITDSTPGATIYYRTNGTYPYPNSYDQYTGPFTVSSSEIVVAIATASGYVQSTWASAEYVITSVPSRFTYTIAGNDTWGYSGDGGPGPAAELSSPTSVVTDASGNVYIADGFVNVVRKIDGKTGIITTIAGTGEPADAGDNGPAASAALWQPSYLALDPSGRLYIAETGDNVVRRLDPSTGEITRFAGDPTTSNYANGPALGINFGEITGLVTDGNGYMFIGDASGFIFKVDLASGIASQYLMYGRTNGFPYTLTFTVDGKDNVYAWAAGYGAIYKITPGGQSAIFAGSMTGGYVPNGGDGGPATKAYLGFWGYLATDAAGNLYISDSWDSAVREVDAETGIINTIAGVLFDSYTAGGSGDPATSVGLAYPVSLFVDGKGNIYLANNVEADVLEITSPALPPTSTTAAPAFSVSGGTYPAARTLDIASATPGAAVFVTFDGSSPVTYMQGYHGPIDINGSATLKAIAVAPGYLKSAMSTASYTITAPPSAVISTVAGNGKYGFSSPGGAATSSAIGGPQATAVDASGNLYIADYWNSVVWKVAAGSGTLSIVAGNGTRGFTGDGGPATSAEIDSPAGVAVDKSGDLYISDYGNGRVRVVNKQTAIITTYAGGGQGTPTDVGDGGPATSASLGWPQGLVFDSSWNLYVADAGDDRIRKVDASTGIISTIAGGGSDTRQLGDGGPATSAFLRPIALTFDKKDNIYAADDWNERIRKIDASTGIITTIAGGGNPGPDGDGLVATDVQISPRGVAVDGSGNVYYSDFPPRVRKVDASTGVLTTVAGNTYYAYSGDGGAAYMATLSDPQQIAFDKAGNLYIPDTGDYVVRKVVFPAPAAEPLFSVPGGSYSNVQQVTLTDSTPNAIVYYTVDGATPDAGSTVYSGSITVRESEMLQAIGVAKGCAISPVASASYIITLQTPVIALSSSAGTAFASNPVTFTATFTTTSGTPTGSVTFMDGTNELATATLSAGAATYTTSSLAAGTHSITAVYGGDNSFNGVTSAAFTEAIEDFTFAPPSGGSTSATVSAGGTATYTLAVTPPSGATTASAITFTVSGMPAGATASFNPTSVAANSGATNVTLSVTAPAQTAGARATQNRNPFLLGLLLLPLLGSRRCIRRARRTWLVVVLAISAAACCAGFMGCGGSGGQQQQQPQTYTLNVTATAGGLSHSTKLTLTVQ